MCLRVPRDIDANALATHLLNRYSTLTVPGRFFEAPDCLRIGLSAAPRLLARGLANISAALDDLERGGPGHAR